MVWFETKQADVDLDSMSPDELTQFENGIYDYYNQARDLFRIDAAREDMVTMRNYLGSVVTQHMTEE